MIYLLSNNSALTLSPDGLPKLAEPQGPREAPSELTESQIHRLSARLRAYQIEDVVHRYKAGESARTLATESGVAPSALLRLLRERNIVVLRKASDEYDPTNLIDIGDRHVLVGRGRDYNDVPPLRGVYAGPFGSTLFVSVEITREA